jgi:hypothetical protein
MTSIHRFVYYFLGTMGSLKQKSTEFEDFLFFPLSEFLYSAAYQDGSTGRDMPHAAMSSQTRGSYFQ